MQFNIIPKTNKEYILVKYGCMKFIDSYRFLSSSFDKLAKTLDENDFIILEKEFPEKWNNLNKKLAYPYRNFNSVDDNQKPVDKLKKEDFFSKLKSKCPDVSETERTKQIIEIFTIKNGEESTSVYMKTDIILLADVFEKSVKVCTKDYGIIPLFCVSICG